MNAKLAKALRKVAAPFSPGHEVEYHEVEHNEKNRIRPARGPTIVILPTSNRYVYLQLKKEQKALDNPEVPNKPTPQQLKRNRQQVRHNRVKRQRKAARLRDAAAAPLQ